MLELAQMVHRPALHPLAMLAAGEQQIAHQVPLLRKESGQVPFPVWQAVATAAQQTLVGRLRLEIFLPLAMTIPS